VLDRDGVRAEHRGGGGIQHRLADALAAVAARRTGRIAGNAESPSSGSSETTFVLMPRPAS